MKKQNKSPRILALDILRGYFLFVIIIDHLYRFPGVLDIFTGQGKLWVSAAEGFFLISGLLVGVIYRDKIITHPKMVLRKLWGRAIWLYTCSIVLTLLFTVWANYVHSPFIKQGWLPLSDLVRLFSDTLSLKYVYGWADFLPYYALFLVGAPVVLYLLSKKLWPLVIFGSLGCWLVRGESVYLAWQIIFYMGLLAGYFLDQFDAKKEWLAPKFYFLALLTLSISYLLVFGIKDTAWHLQRWDFPKIATELNNYYFWWQGGYSHLFDKANLAVGRLLLAFIWIGALYFLVKKYEEKINIFTWGTLAFLGKHSLLVYVLHAIVMFPINLILPVETTWWENFTINLAVIVFIYSLTASLLQNSRRLLLILGRFVPQRQ